ncbi:protein Hook homolog 1-like [Notolabrus celidotus]|uniref:protein Hook homolog 1-like n=1 Tax=Notolabrus celidotus TaxID=1203425 RepID=UPI0014904149|nr:protein Hook homolog 1-like [Notolabrus celidotus]
MENSESTSWYQPMDIDESNETLEEIITRYCRWPSQDKPHPQYHQRRPPQRQERYPAADSQVQELQERLEEEHKQRLQCEEENRCLKEQLKRLKHSFQPQNLTHYVQHTTGKFTGIINDLNQQLTAKEEANKTLKKEVEDLKQWLAEAKTSQTELSSKLTSQNEDMDRLKKEVDNLTNENENQTFWGDLVLKELAEVREKLSALEALDLKEQVDKLTKEKASLTRWSDRLMNELDEVRDQLWTLWASDTKEEVEDLKKRLAEATTSHTELSSKLKSQEDDSDRLKEKVDQLTKENKNKTLWSDFLMKELEKVREQLLVMEPPNHLALKEETDLAKLMKNLSLQDNTGPSLPRAETWTKELIKISPW